MLFFTLQTPTCQRLISVTSYLICNYVALKPNRPGIHQTQVLKLQQRYFVSVEKKAASFYNLMLLIRVTLRVFDCVSHVGPA